MNWKLVATLIVGAFLVVACGSAQQDAPAAPGSGLRGSQPESATPAAAAPASTVSKPPADPKNGVIVHD